MRYGAGDLAIDHGHHSGWADILDVETIDVPQIRRRHRLSLVEREPQLSLLTDSDTVSVQVHDKLLLGAGGLR